MPSEIIHRAVAWKNSICEQVAVRRQAQAGAAAVIWAGELADSADTAGATAAAATAEAGCLALAAVFLRLRYLLRRWRFRALLYCLLILLYFVNAIRFVVAL